MMVDYDLVTEKETQALAHALALVLSFPLSIYFQGEIGAGKTFFIRALLQSLGIKGRIKSPTFSFVESYEVNKLSICHVDLYRLNHEEELVYIGFEELFEEASLRLIEWPEKSKSLPKPDLMINLSLFDQGHRAVIQSYTERGKGVVINLTGAHP
jgi:tRNA threonylcarbamoyladenosine biosynthesis protein TsaE